MEKAEYMGSLHSSYADYFRSRHLPLNMARTHDAYFITDVLSVSGLGPESAEGCSAALKIAEKHILLTIPKLQMLSYSGLSPTHKILPIYFITCIQKLTYSYLIYHRDTVEN